jgi:hypothetical protein
MSSRILNAAIAVALAAIAYVAFAMPAAAEQRTLRVQLANGSIITVQVDAPCVPLSQIPGLPGTAVADLDPSVCAPDVPAVPTTPTSPSNPTTPTQPTTPTTPTNPSGGGGKEDPNANGDKGDKPSSGHGESQEPSGSNHHADGSSNPEVEGEGGKKHHKHQPRRNDGVPTPDNPTYFDALPGPAPTTGVPNFVIQKFKVPIFLLPIYQAAGIEYGIRWEVLAAINEIETDYGRNLNVSTAGAVGWMQFMPQTWKLYGVDANDDGKRDPYNPVDAIFAAARYLKAAGADRDLRRAIFAYNHAGWYVDSVMLRARLIAGYPPDFVGSLTGLTEGRFPVAARAKYADDVQEMVDRKVKQGENAAKVVNSSPNRRGISIYAKQGAPVIASNDGVIKKMGESTRRGRYIVLQDVYGNQYTYSHLGSVQQAYPVPNDEIRGVDKRAAAAVSANDPAPKDPKPTLPASAGTQQRGEEPAAKASPDQATPAKPATDAKPATESAPQPRTAYKARLFAHPQRPNARLNGGMEQIFDRESNAGSSNGGFDTYDAFFAQPVGLNANNSRLRPLKVGSRVMAGTILGRVGKTDPVKAPYLYFEIRPAGQGAPMIDPKPILDGWKLLESTAIYRASGKNALYGESSAFSIGQVLLLPKPLLEKRVLGDPRIHIYPGGRGDIRTGQIDRRVLATLEYLAESGLEPTVSCLKTGHSFLTTSGNVSEHTSGNAVDISMINGTPIYGHQDPGGVADQTVKRLMLLQGTMKPHQIISLLDYGDNTLALADHDDHVHVGFQPLFGTNAKLGKQTASILEPGQWDDLISQLGSIEQPKVPTSPSKYALPVPKKLTPEHAPRGND